MQAIKCVNRALLDAALASGGTVVYGCLLNTRVILLVYNIFRSAYTVKPGIVDRRKVLRSAIDRTRPPVERLGPSQFCFIPVGHSLN